MRATALLALTAVALWASQATAQSLEGARRHYLQAEFEEAAAEFEGVLARPSLTADEAVEAHRYLFVLRQMLGDHDGARRHAAAALALDPAVSLPEGAPPELGAVLEEVRTDIGARRAEIAIRAVDTLQRGHAATIRATLDPAPPELVSQLDLRCVAGTAIGETSGPPPAISVELTPEEAIACRAEARTAAGAPLLDARAQLELATSTAPVARGGGDDLPIWLAVIGVSVAVVGAVVLIAYFATQSSASAANLGAPRIAEW